MTTIKLKRSDVSGKTPLPEDLELGELALNATDGIIYFKNTEGVVTPPSIVTRTEYTVGVGGVFLTINDALETLSNLKPNSTSGKLRLVLKTGFVMAEQVLIKNGVNLSFIEIHSEDDVVSVSRDDITIALSDKRKPIFGADESSTLPKICCKFELGGGSEERVDGLAVFNSSQGTLAPTAGFIGFSRALGAYYGSRVSCYYDGDSTETTRVSTPDFRNSLDTGIYCTFGSYVGCAYGNFSGAGNNGCLSIWGSVVDAYKADFSNATNHGVYCRDASTVNARQSNASGAGKHGYYALHGSLIDARTLDKTLSANNCGISGVLSQHGSRVEFEGGSADNCGSFGIRATQSSIIEARLVSARFCPDGARAENGSTINITGGNVSNCNLGVSVTSSSMVAASSITANDCTNNAVFAEQSSNIDVENGSGLRAGSVSVLARRASTINATNFQGTSATIRGANAQGSSTINAQGANFRKKPASDTTGNNGDIVVLDGSQINATGAVGGINVQKNTISQYGIIFQH